MGFTHKDYTELMVVKDIGMGGYRTVRSTVERVERRKSEDRHFKNRIKKNY